MGVSAWTSEVGRHPVWIAGKELGANKGNVFFTPLTIPGSVSGVDTPRGHVHQSGGPSPKAPTSAGARDAFALSFRPAISRVESEHVEELARCQADGLPSVWLPMQRVESWTIRDVERNNWSLAGVISGSAGERGTASFATPPASWFVPTVNIRAADGQVSASTAPADYPGATTLTIVSGAPATDTEIQIDSTADTETIVTGDLTSYAGGSLVVRYYGTVACEITQLVHTFEEFNSLIQELELVTKAPAKDYEADA